jgi:uncharacterized protein
MDLPCIIIIVLLLAPVLMAAVTSEPEPNQADFYFESLIKGDYDTCTQMSSAKVQAALPAEKLKETWEGLSEQLGGYIDMIGSSVEEKKPYTVHIYALNFAKLVMDMQVTLDEKGVVSGLFFTPSSTSKPGIEMELPDYLSPDKLTIKTIAFDCEGSQVHGLLTLPAQTDSYPLVLMLTGSGPNDMDETVGARKPFRDLANGLANLGIASLRWNKRTRDYPEVFKSKTDFTVRDEYLPEVLAALQWLTENQDVKAGNYYVLGHSMGAFILPLAATEIKDAAGFIMLAGNARPLEDLVVEQYRYIFNLDKMTPEQQKELDKIVEQAQVVKQLAADKPAPDTLLLGAPKAYWLSLNEYKQLEVFRSAAAPFLILQGEKDYQVSMADFALWQAAAKDKKQVRCISYPDLDHLFMQCEGASTQNSYLTPAHVSKQVMLDIAGWITQDKQNDGKHK